MESADDVNIIVTWPKTKPLEDYLRELHRAHRAREQAFFKVPTRPDVLPGKDRCYRVYDGHIRGWLLIVGVVDWREQDVPIDTVTGARFDSGIYIVCNPHWTPTPTYPAMRGFQGYRYTTLEYE